MTSTAFILYILQIEVTGGVAVKTMTNPSFKDSTAFNHSH